MKREQFVSDEARAEKKIREMGHEAYLARSYPLRLLEKRHEEAFAAYMVTTPGTLEAGNALEKYRKAQAEYDGQHTGD